MASGPGYSDSPEHSVVLRRAPGHWIARVGAQLVADSKAALLIEEDGYPPVIYFPPGDVRQSLFDSSERRSYCPFKGQASYLAHGGRDVAWCYARPYDEVAGIAGHFAFYPDRVTVERR